MRIDSAIMLRKLARELLLLGRGLGAGLGAAGLSQILTAQSVAVGLALIGAAVYAYLAGVGVAIVLESLDETNGS